MFVIEKSTKNKINSFINNNSLFHILLVVFISGIVVLIWFKGGFFFGGGEENLTIWNSKLLFSKAQMPWLDFGLGYSSPFWLPRIPVYFFTDFLSHFFTPSSIQAILFWILTSTAGIGMYFLSKYFLGEKNKLSHLLAGLFYILNLYTLSQVWARFVFAGIFAWASLPILLFLWIKWFEEGGYKYLFLFILFSSVFSFSFSHPAFILSFWSVVMLFSVIKIFSKTSNAKKRLLLIYRITLGMFAWLISNIWWIYPYFRLQSSVISNTHDWKYDLASLQGVSVDSKIIDILLLRKNYFFEIANYWGDFYKGVFSYLISLLILVITSFGLIKAKVLKNYRFLWILALISLFVCKGTNPPFGNTIFGFLFQYIPVTRAFRNSYEKFGTVWLLVYSLLFAYGFGFTYQKVSKLWKIILLGVFVPLFLIVLVWPMWKNGPFSPLARIIVPQDYKLADNYLESQRITGRILSLPIIPGEGVKYDWGETSYYGLEPSDILFSEPTISKTVGDKLADDEYMTFYNTFVQKENISKFLSDMNVEYLILHNELDPKYSNASSSAQVKETLKKYSEIRFLKSIGFLDIYRNTNFLQNNFVITDEKVSYNYRKVNSGHYVVEVKKADKPFKLILKTLYNPLWEAKINKSIQKHDIVFGYANGWNIDNKGDYTVDLVFKIWPDFISGAN